MRPYFSSDHIRRLALLSLVQLWACKGCVSPTSQVRQPRQGNKTIKTFREAKRQLKAVYRDHRLTLYCDCPFDGELNIELQACAYNPKQPSKRAFRVEWEHVVPARDLGQTSRAWQQGHPTCYRSNGRAYKGRRCAKKVDQEFRRMFSDMHNLFPSVGAINNTRGSRAMGEIEGEERLFGQCDFERNKTHVEPRLQIKGEIARTYLYMNASYPEARILSPETEEQFNQWSRQDPPDAWECLRTKRIKKIQGNANSFVEALCSASQGTLPTESKE